MTFKTAVIEEKVKIDAAITRVWEMFIDLSCWHEWNTVLTAVSAGDKGKIEEGMSFAFLIRPLAFTVQLEPLAEEVDTCKKIILTGQRFGIRARHEFFFDGNEAQTMVTSLETFTGIPVLLPAWIFFEKRMKKLTRYMLRDLKIAAEAGPKKESSPAQPKSTTDFQVRK